MSRAGAPRFQRAWSAARKSLRRKMSAFSRRSSPTPSRSSASNPRPSSASATNIPTWSILHCATPRASLRRACLLLDEFIDRETDAGRIDASLFTAEAKTIHLHGHCHQKALASLEPTVRMLGLPENYTVKVIPSGCCGMAGSFGYEAEHYDVSMKIGELVLFPAVRMLADGHFDRRAGNQLPPPDPRRHRPRRTASRADTPRRPSLALT